MRRILTSIACLLAAATAHAGGGNVIAVVAGKTLEVAGDAVSNEVRIDQVGLGNEQLRVSPLDGTALNGVVAAAVFDGVTALEITDSGGSSNDWIIENATIADGISYASTDADEIVLLTSLEVGKKIDLDLGDGMNTVTLSGVTLDGKLIYAGGSGVDALTTGDGTMIVKDVKAEVGDGQNAITLASTFVAGKVTVKGGVDGEIVTIDNANTGKVKLNLGEGSNTVIVQHLAVLNQKLEVKTGGLFDDVIIDTSSAALGDVKLNLGEGENEVLLTNGLIAGKLTLTTGDASDSILLSDFGRVFGRTKLQLGDGANMVLLTDDAQVDGALEVKTGDGSDSVGIGDGAEVLGDVKLALGHGTNQFEIGEGGVRADFKLTGGDDADTFAAEIASFGPGKTTLKLGDGQNNFGADDVGFDGNVEIKVGDGDDTGNFSGAVITGTLKVDLGGGTNMFIPPP
jgi:hypothetical protein